MPNFENRALFHGENLDILRGMDSETVDLIATDPPFNKGRDFHATPDSLASGARFQDRWSWDRDIEGEWMDSIRDEAPDVWGVIDFAGNSYGEDMGAFLCFMGVRLMEMHRILKPTGSIYLHCDPTASHYLKAMMDGVFGRRNFRNEIIWAYRGGGVPKKAFARKHDIILSYAKNLALAPFNKQFVEYSDASKKLVKSRGGVSIDNKPRDLDRGAAMPDWWSDINSLQTWSPERSGYPTQKPLALYERIIKASSNPGDVVLDPFCGCATTPIVAERLGRQWVGIDLWDGAYGMIQQRMADIGLASPDTQSTLTTVADIHYETAPPVRTDGGLAAAPHLAAKYKRLIPQAEWQKMSRAEMFDVLANAQRSRAADNLVVCAGCGRSLESRFFHIDHRLPSSEGGEHFITNRVLLCAPCNQTKSDSLTLTGLWRKNRADEWMQNLAAAKESDQRAQLAASKIRDEGDAAERERLMADARARL